MILQCFCTADEHGNNKGQSILDSKYGDGRRVHNQIVSSKGVVGRCTICGRDTVSK